MCGWLRLIDAFPCPFAGVFLFDRKNTLGGLRVSFVDFA